MKHLRAPTRDYETWLDNVQMWVDLTWNEYPFVDELFDAGMSEGDAISAVTDRRQMAAESHRPLTPYESRTMWSRALGVTR